MDNQSSPPDKPPLAVSDQDVQSLLMVTNAAAKVQPKAETHLKMIIAIIVLVALVLLSSYLLGDIGSNGKLKQQSNIQSSGQSNDTSGRGINNEINQDVKSCQNPAIAVSQC